MSESWKDIPKRDEWLDKKMSEEVTRRVKAGEDAISIGLKINARHNKVDHPKHYNMGTIEVIDLIEDWKLDFNEGNLIKYFVRAKYKGNYLEDMEKAKWYLQRLIDNERKKK